MTDIKFEIVKEVGVLSETSKGWRKEINLVSWNGAAPMYDIRSWSPDKTKMSKGITLNDFELVRLLEIVKQQEGFSDFSDSLKRIGDTCE